MAKKEIIFCDGPACTQEIATREGRIDVFDWAPPNRPFSEREFFFCSWICLEAFSDAKIISTK